MLTCDLDPSTPRWLVGDPGRLLIIADPDFLDEIAPLAEWETLVGYPTSVVSTSVTGTTAASIKRSMMTVPKIV